MEKRIPTLLVVEDKNVSHLLEEVFGPDIGIVQEYGSVAAAIELINRGEVEAVLTGWKIRKADPLEFNDELAAPRIVAAAKKANIPVVVVSGHPDAKRFQGALVIDKTTMELNELKDHVKGMLSLVSSQG